MLGPSSYGIYQTVISYVGLFGFLTFSGLNKVLIRECSKDLKKTKQILEDTIGLRNLFSFLAAFISIIIVLFIDYDNGTKFYIAIFSITLIINGFRSSLNTIYQSFENMKFLAAFSVIRQLIIVPLSILLLKLGYGILSLILLSLIINSILLIVNFYYSKRFIIFNIFSKIKFIKYYIKAGFNFTLLEFLNTLSGKIDLVMLSFLTTPQNVGIYAFAYRIVEKGLFVRNPISQSLFPYYTKKIHNDHIKSKTLLKHTLFIFIPSVIIAFLVSLISKKVIITFIGTEYSESAVILNILIFYLIFNYSVIPFALFLQVTGNERRLIFLGLIRAFLNVILNLFLFYTYGTIGIAYSTLITFGIWDAMVMVKGYKLNIIKL